MVRLTGFSLESNINEAKCIANIISLLVASLVRVKSNYDYDYDYGQHLSPDKMIYSVFKVNINSNDFITFHKNEK